MYQDAYIQYLVHFHGPRDYFECHEILEEFWKKEGKHRSSIWVGFIQLAVALYHHRIENYNGAFKTITKAINNFHANEQLLQKLGLDKNTLLTSLEKRREEIVEEKSYYSMNLPIIDDELKKICIEQCQRLGFHWNSNSDLSNQYLLYKHSLRDRSQIIKERREKLKRKQNKRP